MEGVSKDSSNFSGQLNMSFRKQYFNLLTSNGPILQGDSDAVAKMLDSFCSWRVFNYRPHDLLHMTLGKLFIQTPLLTPSNIIWYCRDQTSDEQEK